MPDVHAWLSASGAKRWMSCPPSVRLEEQFPEKSSTYAEEGTFAHAFAEQILRYNAGEITKKAFTTRINKLKQNEFYSKELEDYIVDYTQQVWEIFNEAKAICPDAQALFEQRLDFSNYVPDGFGTGDVVIIADGLVQVIDLKYGKGIGVSAENNPQLRLYAVGAYLEHSFLYDIRRVRMTIIQPRLDNVSTEELTADELIAWAENDVRPKALLAIAGDGDFCVGDHCQFCKARAVCRARADYNQELAKLDFADPELLTDDEIGEVLARAVQLQKWVADVQGYAFDEALKGKKFNGWKLVEGRSNRKYTDEDDAGAALLLAGYPKEDIYNSKLKGITDMEKLLGKQKFGELLKDLVIKPEGKPVLVPETDKRKEINSTTAAVADFN